MIILDTNVISEAWRLKPSSRFMTWINSQPRVSLFTTAITEAEVFYGIALMPNGRRRRELESEASTVFDQDFVGRILPFDSSAARRYAEIMAARRRAGQPISEADAQIAAIAHSRGATIATRDVADFADCGVSLVNPWHS